MPKHILSLGVGVDLVKVIGTAGRKIGEVLLWLVMEWTCRRVYSRCGRLEPIA